MRGVSRHRPSRPDRSGTRAATQPAPRPAPRPAVPAAEPERLTRVLEPVVQAGGMDLESVRLSAAGRRRLLRVVVDADGGVSLDDIALISRELSARLDATGAMGEVPYTLEVSSPGVGRPLTVPRHWRRAVGRLVTVPLAGPPAGEPPAGAVPAQPVQLRGRVISAGGERVTLEVAGQRRDYRYDELGPGRVQVEFGQLAAGPGDDEPPAEPTRGRPDGH